MMDGTDGFWVSLNGVATDDAAPVQDRVSCKRCESTNTVKFGRLKGVQRWLCKDCRYKFAQNNAFPGMKTPAGQIARVLCMYYEGMGVSEICRYLQQTYNSYPSDSTLYGWIDRFTRVALEAESKNTPHVSDTWIAITTPLRIGEEGIRVWDILDSRSRFILASHTSVEITPHDAGIVLEMASKKAGKIPAEILTDQAGVFQEYLKSVKGRSKETLARKALNASESGLLDNYRSTLEARTAVIQGFKNIESAQNVIRAWPLHYNYFRPHEITTNTTPACRADIPTPLKIRVR